MQIVAISGSLRAGSSNTLLLQSMGRLAPAGVHIELWEGLGALPQFNPDLDEVGTPREVLDFRTVLLSADAVLISSPEYAHGVPGSLKNALDWLVGTGELVGKPVALINASSRSMYAHAQLMETLTVMNWRVVKEASITLPLAARLEDPAIESMLLGAIAALAAAVHR
jgi:chromate reductase, NAD(P)H dehydrogenase (quinone)